MGIDKNGARFLFYSRALGVDFSRTAMIGRQGLHVTRKELTAVLRVLGQEANDAVINSLLVESGGYAERFIGLLGAKIVHSFDHSDYEGATHVHDMNRPIPSELAEQYSVVIDGGTLEHIFNFPVALRNCMEMVAVGGHLLMITPANNFMGHGFYQFSPELFFSVFVEKNGFEVVKIIAFEEDPDARWYAVKSPIEARHRVTLINRHPVYLAVIARRRTRTEVLLESPQQSDYKALWKGQSVRAHAWGEGTAGIVGSFFEEIARKLLPVWVKRLLLRLLGRSGIGFERRFFTPIHWTQDRERS